MRVLLDQNISPQIASGLTGHDAMGAVAAGFESFKNGRLLAAAEEAGFEVLVTIDKNMRHQQNFAGRKIALIVLDIHTIGIRAVTACVPAILDALESISTGQIVVIEGPHPKRNT